MLLAHVFHKHRGRFPGYTRVTAFGVIPLHTSCCVSGFDYIVYVHWLLYRKEGITYTIRWNPEQMKMQMCLSSHCIADLCFPETLTVELINSRNCVDLCLCWFVFLSCHHLSTYISGSTTIMLGRWFPGSSDLPAGYVKCIHLKHVL